MTLDGWITFWTWVCIIGCAAGAVMFLIILPLGFRDLFRLYHVLNAERPLSDETSRDRESGGPG